MFSKILDNVERVLVPFSLYSTLVCLGTMLLALTLYALTGHYSQDDRFFPTISATEHFAPEYYVYAIGFTYCGIALNLSISAVHLRIIAPAVQEKKWARRTNYVSLVLGLIAGFNFAIQTYWPVEHLIHSVGSGAFFYIGIVYCLLVTIVTRTQECRSLCFQKMWKVKLLMLVIYSLCIVAFGLGLLDSYAGRKTFVYMYVGTLSEWGAAYAFILFFSTFGFDANEYRKIKAQGEKLYQQASEQEIVLTELSDGFPDKSYQIQSQDYTLDGINEGIEELLTVVVAVTGSEDNNNGSFCSDSDSNENESETPLVTNEDDGASKKRKLSLVDVVAPGAIYAAYVSLLLFSVVGFLLLKIIF